MVLAHGGLGNQLFQYAAARGFNSEVDVISYGGDWGPDHPSLKNFGIPVSYPNRRIRSITPGISVRESWRDDVSRVSAMVSGFLRGTRVLTQSNPFAKREELNGKYRHVVLNGYFQHSSWWEESWREVAQECALSEPSGVSKFRSTSPAVIKIRRSDYLTLGVALDKNWLRQALDKLHIRQEKVFVIAEDEEGLEFSEPILRELGCEQHVAPTFSGDRNMDDFWTISAGQRVVAANSSFAWWAAAIAEVKGSPVIAYPKPWLPNAWTNEELPDFGLPTWIPIDSKTCFTQS